MARDRNQKTTGEVPLDMEQVRLRLEMLDNRLDSIDSMVSAVVERVMSQVLNIHLTCPRCGKDIEVGIIGNKKPTA